jgi:hypothetical protein
MRAVFGRKLSIFLAIICLALSACGALTNVVGTALEGRRGNASIGVLAESFHCKDFAVSIYTEGLQITFPAFPSFVLYGTKPSFDDTFILTKAAFLANSLHGWNEVEFSASGRGSFNTAPALAELRMDSPPILSGVSSGRIRLMDTRLSGDAALRELQGRDERIKAGKPSERDREEAAEWIALNAAWPKMAATLAGGRELTRSLDS